MREAEGKAISPRSRWVVAKVVSQMLNRREGKACGQVGNDDRKPKMTDEGEWKWMARERMVGEGANVLTLSHI
jgi:hypothetical protein